MVNGQATSIQDTTSLLPALGMSNNDLASATELRMTLESVVDLRPVLFLGYAQDATVEGNGPPTRVGTLVAAAEEEGQSYPRFFLRQEGYSTHVALSLKGGIPTEVVIRFEKHIDKPTPRALVLMSPQYLEDNTFRGFSHFFSGIFQGMIWVLILYHLLLYQSVRETSYLWYCIYMASISALTLGDLGYWQTGWFKNYPVLGWHLYQAMQYVTGILTLVFMRSFVQLKRLNPRWDFIVQRFIEGNLGVLALLGLVLFFTGNGLALVFAKILIIPFAAFGLWVCWILFRSGDTVARYFAVAGCITAVAVAVNAGAEFFFAAVTITEKGGVKLNMAEQIPGTDFIRFYWVHGAVILHLLTFAMGMGYRRRQNDLELQRTREIDEMKTRFYTNITHEFRTPLTVILGMADQITTQPKQSSLIKRNAQQLLRLINQLLGLSRLEAKQVTAEYEHGEVISYLKYLSESFHSLAKDKGVKLTFYSEVSELKMDYDPEKLQQIVYNLLSNAIKFTPEGGQVILHLQELETKGHQQLQLKVSDTGVGIPQEALPKIFDRFYQVDGSSTREGEGTGVGLAFTQGLVRLLDGQIEVSSGVGKGTSFTVCLPVRNVFSDKAASTDFASSEAILAPAVPRPNGLASPEASTNRTNSENGIVSNDEPLLLLVDDNADILEYLVSLLAGKHQLLRASNGKDGFRVATEQTPDLIISDVMMPQMNGYELCELLKSNLRTSHIP
ncbi:MAG: ATP-binding protein, partial [Bacteroidota bacterium]